MRPQNALITRGSGFLIKKSVSLDEDSLKLKHSLNGVNGMIIDRTQVDKVDIISKKTGQRYSSYQDIREHCNIQNFNVRYEEIRPHSQACAPHKHTELEEFYVVLSGQVTVYEGDSKNIAQPGDMIYLAPQSSCLHYLANESNQPASMVALTSISATDKVIYSQ